MEPWRYPPIYDLGQSFRSLYSSMLTCPRCDSAPTSSRAQVDCWLKECTRRPASYLIPHISTAILAMNLRVVHKLKLLCGGRIGYVIHPAAHSFVTAFVQTSYRPISNQMQTFQINDLTSISRHMQCLDRPPSFNPFG